jgi:UDP-N-acetylglucosamine 4-epimerase
MDVVLHHAALGSVPRSIENPVRTNEVNVNGFVNILFAAKECGVKKVVYASSSSVYGDDDTFPKTESKTGNLLSPYAVSKRTNEEYAKVFARLYDMEVTGLRYFNVFGERQTPDGPYAAVIPRFIDAVIHNRQASIFGTGNNTRDFTYVANVIRANLLCIENAVPKGIVMNIACGGTISVNDIYYNIAKALESNLKPNYLPERPGEIKNSYADISLATATIGYKPVVTLEEGLQKTVSWFRSHVKSGNIA